MSSPAGDPSTAVSDQVLREHFESLARTSLPRAPLNAALCAVIADDPSLYGLMRHAPPTQLNPVLLLACVHASLLADQDHPLAAWYPNLVAAPRGVDEPGLAEALSDLVTRRRDAIVELVRTRSTQTNEVGRSAMLLLAFAMLADEVGPLGHLDVGTSAGLNLLLDRFAYRYHPRHDPDRIESVGPRSEVTITVGTSGKPPVPRGLPPVAARCGIDLHPIDVSDDDEARWLEACVWPDQTDRFERLRAAIAIARRSPPDLLAGEAVASLERGVDAVGHGAHPVVTNSWVLNYFTGERRRAYLGELDRLGAGRDLSWVWFESPLLTPELPAPDAGVADPSATVLSLARWRNGRRTVEHLAVCHPHGYWVRWLSG